MTNLTKTLSQDSIIHFIGIGGIGMCAIAAIAADRGFAIQGSDLSSNRNTEDLANRGVKIFPDHQQSHLNNAGLVVYSSAIDDQHEERKGALEKQIPCVHRSEFLHWLMLDKKAITVSGTHGKTTTSAMIAHMLLDMGLDPSIAVGGRMHQMGGPSRCGKGPLFVAEADESDGSFLRYRPYLSILTNIDTDHLDHYENLDGIQSAFTQYLENTDPEGVAIIGWDQAIAREVGQKLEKPRLTYGTVIGCDVRGINYDCQNGLSTFQAIVERDLVPCTIPMLGKHNMQNALCALAVARALELDIKRAAKALESFLGVERRMSQIYCDKNIKIFDDYAHNPGKIAACISAIKESWPDTPLHVIHQPHRYSRLDTMFDQTLASFAEADYVYFLPVFSAGEETTKDYRPETLARIFKQRSSKPSFGCENFQDAVNLFQNHDKQKPSLVLTVGAGDVWKVAELIKERMA